MSLHKAALYGFTKGDLYEAGRPSYTDESVDYIINEFHKIKSTADVQYYDILELGAGTGKFTNCIIKKLKNEKYLASEPSDGFYETFQKKYPEIDCLQFAANNIPLPDSSVKAVICAQCFHWFCNVESMKEIRRVLAPEGKLFLIWNVKDFKYDWVREWVKLIREGQPPSPNYYTLEWKKNIDDQGIFACEKDDELQGVEFGGTIDFLIQNIMSVSVVNLLSDEEKKKLSDKVRQYLVNVHGDKEYIKVPFKTKIMIYRVQ